MKGSLERGIKFYNTKRYEQALNEFHATGIEPSENNDLAYYTGPPLKMSVIVVLASSFSISFDPQATR